MTRQEWLDRRIEIQRDAAAEAFMRLDERIFPLAERLYARIVVAASPSKQQSDEGRVRLAERAMKLAEVFDHVRIGYRGDSVHERVRFAVAAWERDNQDPGPDSDAEKPKPKPKPRAKPRAKPKPKPAPPHGRG